MKMVWKISFNAVISSLGLILNLYQELVTPNIFSLWGVGKDYSAINVMKKDVCRLLKNKEQQKMFCELKTKFKIQKIVDYLLE
jgi:hypothetical protein